VYGIKIPSKHLPTIFPEMVLVPLVCFNPVSKQRVGYGGGYYDEYMRYCQQETRNTVFVGIGYESLR
jgi:5-formyltetrahydrofolate cyclo-ligase